MAASHNPNLAQLLAVARKLESILDQLVFVGGCVTGLLVTDPGAAPVRATLDVDAIVEVASYAEYTLLEDRLRSFGFHESQTERAHIGRWEHGNLVFDLLPTDPVILGFGNRWYPAALQNAKPLRVEALELRLITAPFFLATKFEAFYGRGKGDYRMSRDLEDIVTVIDGRPELVAEVRDADAALRDYLREQFSALLATRDFTEALPGYLLPDAASQQRIGIVTNRIRQIIAEGLNRGPA
jgi:predicted nucleotidyltransferase